MTFSLLLHLAPPFGSHVTVQKSALLPLPLTPVRSNGLTGGRYHWFPRDERESAISLFNYSKGYFVSLQWLPHMLRMFPWVGWRTFMFSREYFLGYCWRSLQGANCEVVYFLFLHFGTWWFFLQPFWQALEDQIFTLLFVKQHLRPTKPTCALGILFTASETRTPFPISPRSPPFREKRRISKITLVTSHLSSTRSSISLFKGHAWRHFFGRLA